MGHAKQSSLIELLIDDERPVQDWAEGLLSLPPRIYPRDDQLARDLERAIKHFVFAAADLDCIGTDDPTAPPLGASTRQVLPYLFRRWPDMGADLNRLVSQAAQILGRRAVLSATAPISRLDRNNVSGRNS